MRRPAAALAAHALAVLLVGCSTDAGAPESPGERAPSAAGSTAPASPEPEPRPPLGGCYRLGLAGAVSASPDAEPVDCEDRHTSLTYHVDTLPRPAGGPDAARARLTRTCEGRLPRFLGATPRTLRLSMLRAVWFAPRLEDAERPEDWYRCDVVALAGGDRLAPLAGPMKGALSTPAGLDRYGVCGTARPGTRRFERVVCSRPHAWRATTSYDVGGGRYPGPAALREAGAETCRAEAEALATDALDYEWAMDWPTREQWGEGRRWGLCWAPA